MEGHNIHSQIDHRLQKRTCHPRSADRSRGIIILHRILGPTVPRTGQCRSTTHHRCHFFPPIRCCYDRDDILRIVGGGNGQHRGIVIDSSSANPSFRGCHHRRDGRSVIHRRRYANHPAGAPADQRCGSCRGTVVPDSRSRSRRDERRRGFWGFAHSGVFVWNGANHKRVVARSRVGFSLGCCDSIVGGSRVRTGKCGGGGIRVADGQYIWKDVGRWHDWHGPCGCI
mmetsp:Transcript_17968/g.32139  ORF Transcript_17968/g.32139 Transcript_17968/m.32139 type:complete len:227 (+) Transcript_17968:233-913(+)